VGCREGCDDGMLVGRAVGIAVGTAVGISVGFAVGAAVGAAVGLVVGTAVGIQVGSAVGTGQLTTATQIPCCSREIAGCYFIHLYAYLQYTRRSTQAQSCQQLTRIQAHLPITVD
jgi:uncharacterized protein YcfJ